MQLWITQIMKAVSLWSQKCVVTHVIQEHCRNCSSHFHLEGEKVKRLNADTPEGSYPHSTLLFSRKQNPTSPTIFLQKARTSTVTSKVHFLNLLYSYREACFVFLVCAKAPIQ